MMGEGGGGKMMESLRLGLATVSKKVGNKNQELIRKLETEIGGQKQRLEVFPPPRVKQQAESRFNLSTNPLTLQDVPKNSNSGKDERNDRIGRKQHRLATPGLSAQSGRLYQGPGQARPEAGVGRGQRLAAATGTSIASKYPCDQDHIGLKHVTE